MKRDAKRYIYHLGPYKTNVTDTGVVSNVLRAQVLNRDSARCQMCGRTVSDDGIQLQIDHKVPQSWGGLTVIENLWSLCVDCNSGKQAHFRSFDSEEMIGLMAISSVHLRIATFLRGHLGKPVDSHVIEFVANAKDRQEDWQKRLRELRYPVIGLEIDTGRRKTSEGFIRSTYTLNNWRDIPVDHQQLIRQWEKKANRTELLRMLDIR